MCSLRVTFVTIVAVSALILGALFSLPVSRKSFARVSIGGVAIVAELADDPHAKLQGLAGRTALPRFAGMLFRFDQPDLYGIWLKGMRFPIDILWLREGRVVDVEEGVPPPGRAVPDSLLPIWRPDVSADAVLELRAGFAREHRIKIGDRVRITMPGGEIARAEAPLSGAPLGPGSGYTIERLRENPPEGRNFQVLRLLVKNDAYQKFLITYRSGDLTLDGVMNVPLGEPPAEGFPVLVLNHGWIMPEIYFSGRGSRREQDFFTRRGYVTIHPDYRGFASSSPDTATHHDFFVGYTEDVRGLIAALRELDSPLFDLSRIGVWGHSMGGAIAARLIVLEPAIRAFVLFAPNSARVEDNFYELSPAEISWLRERYGKEGAEVYRMISPVSYFADTEAPVQLHHGTRDAAVPPEFSEEMFRALSLHGKRVELFLYPGEAHEFGEAWTLAAERSLQFFDRYVKQAR